MARINRSDVIQKAVNDLAISTSQDKVPNETLDKVQLTYDLNRHFSSFSTNASRTTTGTLSLSFPAIDARSEIYLTSVDVDMIKDVVCDLATSSLGIAVTTDLQGIQTNILNISTISLTAQQVHAHVDLNYPLKLKPNTTVAMAGTFTAGVLVRSIAVTGFIVSTN